MSSHTGADRRADLGWWISVIAIAAIAILQIGVIVDAAVTGESARALHESGPSK